MSNERRGLEGRLSSASSSSTGAGFLESALDLEEVAAEAFVLALFRDLGTRGSSSLGSWTTAGSGSGSGDFRLAGRFGLDATSNNAAYEVGGNV